MKVVVTGSQGGTGKSIVDVFRDAGHDVIGIDIKAGDFWDSQYRRCDLTDGACVHDVLAGSDAVVHFGSLPTDGWTSWEDTYRNLALGGYHILQASANLGIRRLVMASSPEIYGDNLKVPYLPVDEQTPANPGSIYGATKQNLETLAEHYVRWHGMAVAALRPQRIVYHGSYEWRFRRFTQDDTNAIDALWSYIDARDVGTACLAWIESELQGFEAFNVAADDVCVTTETMSLVKEHYSHVSDIRADLPGRSGLVDCSKLKKMLGWQPVHQWQQMAEESQQQGFSRDAPPR